MLPFWAFSNQHECATIDTSCLYEQIFLELRCFQIASLKFRRFIKLKLTEVLNNRMITNKIIQTAW